MKIDLLQYFDVELTWDEDFPKIKLQLKESFKITNNPLFRTDGRPVSGANVQYYIHYLGDDIGESVYNERKKLFSKQKLIDWYISTFDVDVELRQKMLDYNKYLSKKMTDGQLRQYQSPEGETRRQQIKDRMELDKWKIAKMNSEKWKDEDFRNRQMQIRKDIGHYENVSKKAKDRMTDPEYKRWFDSRMNDPSRCLKISEHSLKMWKEYKDGVSDRYSSLVFKGGSVKKFELNGYKMNQIEFIVGSLLNDMRKDWVYGKVFKFERKWYMADYFIPDNNLIIECNGDYWHASPKRYVETDVIHSGKLAKEFWEYDLKKQLDFTSNGYKYLILWESEIYDKIDYCVQQINNFYND